MPRHFTGGKLPAVNHTLVLRRLILSLFNRGGQVGITCSKDNVCPLLGRTIIPGGTV